MPRDGSNTYSLPEAPFVPNTVALASTINSNLNDIATALTDSFTRAETTTFTRTLLDDTTAGAARATLGVELWGGTAGGTANAITIAPTPVVVSYVAGMRVSFVVAATNTGNVTINLNAIGAQPLRRFDGTEIGRGVLRGGSLVQAIAFSATEFRLVETPCGLIELDRYVAASDASVVWQLPAGYEQFEFRIDNLVPGTDGATPLLQVSENGGSTWFNGASDYAAAYAANNLTAFNGATFTTSGFWLLQQLDTTLNFNGLTVNLWPGSATRRAQTRSFSASVNDGTSQLQAQVAGGARAANGRANAVRLIMSSGNVATATISLLGIRA